MKSYFDDQLRKGHVLTKSYSTNLASLEPDLTRSLCIHLRDYLKEIGADMPTLDPEDFSFSGVEPDVDADGLNDEWEFRKLLSYHFGSEDDPDGDGMTNAQEFDVGTDPYNTNVNTLSVKNQTTHIAIFPNPTKYVLHLNLSTTISLPPQLGIKIMDTSGRTLSLYKVEKANQISIEINQLISGMYYLVLGNEHLDNYFLGAHLC